MNQFPPEIEKELDNQTSCILCGDDNITMSAVWFFSDNEIFGDIDSNCQQFAVYSFCGDCWMMPDRENQAKKIVKQSIQMRIQ